MIEGLALQVRAVVEASHRRAVTRMARQGERLRSGSCSVRDVRRREAGEAVVASKAFIANCNFPFIMQGEDDV